MIYQENIYWQLLRELKCLPYRMWLLSIGSTVTSVFVQLLLISCCRRCELNYHKLQKNNVFSHKSNSGFLSVIKLFRVPILLACTGYKSWQFRPWPVLLESISFNAPRNWKLATRISRLVVSGWLKIGWSSVFVQTRLTFYPSNFTWQLFVLSCSELMHGCMFVATVLFTADISHLHYLVKGTLQVFQYRCFLPYKLWRLILLTSLFAVLFNLPKVS